MKRTHLILLLALVLPHLAASAQTPRGIVGREAPPWDVTQWINLPDGVTAIDRSDFDGKVVYLYCFQSWCPGCHSRGFPTLQALIRRYEDQEDVAFVAVQTVFEGFSTNTVDAAWDTARRYQLEIPVGHSGESGRRSELMRRYRNGGTPWVVIIDKHGQVRFNDFHISVPQAARTIDALRTADGVGQQLVGTKLPELEFDRWIKPDDDADAAAPKLTLYRWWTDGCPYCEKSLPGLERLRTKYGSRGLAVVGVYHPKPRRRVRDADVLRAAHAVGYHGDLAVDETWTQLDLAFDPASRRATSISLLVDDERTIRFVHPGPVLFPSDDPANARANADYERLEAAIKELLGE